MWPLPNIHLALKVFVAKTASVAESNYAVSGAAVFQFIQVMKVLAGVFEVSSEVFHIYLDSSSPVVAFNRNRTLFFNLHYFSKLHFKITPETSLSFPGSFSGVETVGLVGGDALYYWFLVVCHELAHNFVSDHNSEFSFYLMSFAEMYMKNLMQYMNRNGIF